MPWLRPSLRIIGVWLVLGSNVETGETSECLVGCTMMGLDPYDSARLVEWADRSLCDDGEGCEVNTGYALCGPSAASRCLWAATSGVDGCTCSVCGVDGIFDVDPSLYMEDYPTWTRIACYTAEMEARGFDTSICVAAVVDDGAMACVGEAYEVPTVEQFSCASTGLLNGPITTNCLFSGTPRFAAEMFDIGVGIPTPSPMNATSLAPAALSPEVVRPNITGIAEDEGGESNATTATIGAVASSVATAITLGIFIWLKKERCIGCTCKLLTRFGRHVCALATSCIRCMCLKWAKPARTTEGSGTTSKSYRASRALSPPTAYLDMVSAGRETSPHSSCSEVLPLGREDIEVGASSRDQLEGMSLGAVSRQPNIEANEAKLEGQNDAKMADFASATPPIGQTWLSSCGDIAPGVRTGSPDGAQLSMHSVGKLALRAVAVSGRVLHLPPDEASGAVCQKWRDKHGRVEVKVASEDRRHVETVTLLDSVCMEDVMYRGETGPCLIKPVIQGPHGVKFLPGTASISYFIGRYGTMVLNKGNKGGMEGMDSYVHRNYFPVTEEVEGASKRWVADSNFKIVWRGDEIWLETELRGFSRRGLAKMWDRLRGRIQEVSCHRASSTAKAATGARTGSTSGTVSPSSTPTQRARPLSLEPLGSERYPVGSIEVNNATKESLQVMLIPETFLTAEAHARSRNANLGLKVAGQGLSAGGGSETSGNISQQPTFMFSSLTRSNIPAGATDHLQLPGGAQTQCRLIWCSVSQPFEPHELRGGKYIGDADSKNQVTENVVAGHGYEIVNTGTNEHETLRFKEMTPAADGSLHRSLLFVRVWSQTSITAHNSSTMRPSVLADSCLWDASVPSKQHINNKILDGMISKISTTPALFG